MPGLKPSTFISSDNRRWVRVTYPVAVKMYTHGYEVRICRKNIYPELTQEKVYTVPSSVAHPHSFELGVFMLVYDYGALPAAWWGHAKFYVEHSDCEEQ